MPASTPRLPEGEAEARFRDESFQDSYWLHQFVIGCALTTATYTLLVGRLSSATQYTTLLASGAFRVWLHSCELPRRARVVGTCLHFVLTAMPHVEMLVRIVVAKCTGGKPPQADRPDLDQMLFPVLLCSFGMPIQSRLLLLCLALQASLLSAHARSYDAVRHVLLHVVCFGAGHVIERERRRSRAGFQRQKEALQAAREGRRADSRLNHVIKNKSAEATFLVGELVAGVRKIQRTLEQRGGMLSIGAQLSQLLDHLSSVHSIHAQTSEWVHQRQLFIQLQDGSYKTRLVRTDLSRLLRNAMRAGDDDVSIWLPVPPVFAFDASILRLQLEEARSNAIKYRAPGSKLVVRAELRGAGGGAIGAQGAGPGPAGSGDCEMHLTLDNENHDGMPALSVAQCQNVFADGTMGECGGAESALTGLGNGIGLDTVSAAARAGGGRAWLSTRVSDETGAVHTVFHTVLPARLDGGGPVPEQPTSQPTLSDASSRICAPAARRGPSTSDETGFGPSAGPSPVSSRSGRREAFGVEGSGTGGDRSSDDALDARLKLALTTACGRPPVCFALDDSPLLQLALNAAFKRLSADAVSAAVGRTAAEQASFADLVLGEGGQPPRPGRPHADIVVLDYHLDLGDEARPSGLEHARVLHDRGYRGMMALHSGLRPDELRAVEAMPYIHMVLKKDGNPRELANHLATAYLDHASARLRASDNRDVCPAVGTDSPAASRPTTPLLAAPGCDFRRRSAFGGMNLVKAAVLDPIATMVGGCVY
mmetsp:Transcript_2775/g.9378  ORF Transcript_2775/g.9378 Transcript_2775/m.9378 type:complete len:764 (-) Transcript_2775:708-2999(-)